MPIKSSIQLLKTCVLAAAFLALASSGARAQGRSATANPAPAGPWMNPDLPPDQRADLVLRQMTFDEKIQLVHGGGGGFGAPGAGQQPPNRSNGGAGWIPGIPRLGIPDLNMADSAVGVTRGAARSRYSTGLPSSLAEAATWDLKLAYLYGSVIGRELRDQGYNMSIGGGVDITREPRNGRNFEYQGEDPILAGKMVGQLMKGCPGSAHHGRHQALRVERSGDRPQHRECGSGQARHARDRPAGIRDRVYATPAPPAGDVLLQQGEWRLGLRERLPAEPGLEEGLGLQGLGACRIGAARTAPPRPRWPAWTRRCPAARISATRSRRRWRAARFPMARLNDMVHRILRTEFAVGVIDHPPVPRVVDVFQGLEDAQRIAEEGTVLLKNANQQLPLNAAAVQSIAVIGSHADAGVLSGGGSAQVDPPGGNAVPPPPAPPGHGRARHWGRGPVYYPSSPAEGHSRQSAQGQGGIQRRNRSGRRRRAGQGVGSGHRVRQPAHQRRPRLPQPLAARRSGRPGERRGRRQSAHHRGARDRRAGQPCRGSTT